MFAKPSYFIMASFSICTQASFHYSIFRYARTVGARHFHTSAKQNRGIEELFLDLAQQMMATADKKAKSGGGGGGGTRTDGAAGGGRNNIRIVDDIEVSLYASLFPLFHFSGTRGRWARGTSTPLPSRTAASRSSSSTSRSR